MDMPVSIPGVSSSLTKSNSLNIYILIAPTPADKTARGPLLNSILYKWPTPFLMF